MELWDRLKNWDRLLQSNRGNKMNALYRDLKKLVEKSEKETKIAQKWRLRFHLMPPIGWLNDPNGLCQVKEDYHFFFQYSPFDATGGLKFWGHYKSNNMIEWEYIDTALFPDQPYDCHGVYSGSVLVEDDTMHLFYTGNVKFQGDYNYITEGRGSNTIYAQCKNGLLIEEKKCIMTNADYPADLTCHVRDPKVWKEKGKYYMVLGARTKEDIGQVLLYCSKDKVNWKLVNRLMAKEKFGYMWECPDLFYLNNTTILSVSPQGVEEQGKKYQNIYQSGYYIVKGDFEAQYELENFKEWDNGFDFYAPQTFEDKKGRRILVGWMGMPDCEDDYTNLTVELGWQHAFTMPRVLEYKEGKMIQSPIEELKEFRKKETVFHQFITCESCFELFISSICSADCQIEIDNQVKIIYSKEKSDFTLCFEGKIGAGRTKRSIDLKECRSIRLFSDMSCLEIFVNEGENVFTTRYYPQKEIVDIKINCESSKNILWLLDGFCTKGEEIKP